MIYLLDLLFSTFKFYISGLIFTTFPFPYTLKAKF